VTVLGVRNIAMGISITIMLSAIFTVLYEKYLWPHNYIIVAFWMFISVIIALKFQSSLTDRFVMAVILTIISFFISGMTAVLFGFA
jgi:hypothetical protein